MRNFYNNKSRGPADRQKGQVVMITVVAFLVISLAVISGVAVPTSNQVKSVLDLRHSKQGYIAADSVNEEMFYRLNKSWALPPNDTSPLLFSNGIDATVQVTDVGDTKQIVTTGTDGETIRKAKSVFSTGVGAAFSYGLQVGNGGVTMSNSPTIYGSVYSNGDFVGTANSTVTGSVTVANTSDPVSNQSNGSGVPANNLTFANALATQDIAQSFKVSTGGLPVTNVRIYIKKTGAPANATVRITGDSSGKPNTNYYGTGNLSAGLVTTTDYGYIEVPMGQTQNLNTTNTYWILIDAACATTCTNTYTLGATGNTYANGNPKIGRHDNSTWNVTNPSAADLYFDVYLGGHNGSISSSQANPVSIGGPVWAHEVNKVKLTTTGSTAVGYCEASNPLYNSSGAIIQCDNSREDPVQLPFPVSDANIQEWKDIVAVATDDSVFTGGDTHTGNLTIGNETTSTITKVTGNLTLNSDCDVTFGDLYVVGNLSVENGCEFHVNTLKVGGKVDLQGTSISTVGFLKVGGNTAISTNGNLAVMNGSFLTLSNMVWITKNFSLQGNSRVNLDSSFGSRDGLIIIDGTLSNLNGGDFLGSGTSATSYIMAVTTNTSASAVTLAGNSGSVVIVAPYGTASVQNGAGVRSITAYKISISGDNTNITYDEGLAGLDFSTGATGSWAVDSWGEVAE